jgi:hypothetical protein
MSIDTVNGNYTKICVRRQHEYPPEEWARLTAKWDSAEEEHGPGYCSQPMCCLICIFKHQRVGS